VAAYTSTLSALLNWGGSFVINDLYRPLASAPTVRREIWLSRLTTVLLFGTASVVTVLFVKHMVSWFLFINDAMVVFLLPLAFFRFFWWRFNAWGELAATVLGLPLSIWVWFGLDFQDAARHPLWQGLGLLFALSFGVLLLVTWLTPAESPETLKRFFERCQPPGFWGPYRVPTDARRGDIVSTRRLLANSLLGVIACLGLVLATNAVFVGSWLRALVAATAAVLAGTWLVRRALGPAPANPSALVGQAQTTMAAGHSEHEQD
jgi:hypothetical protein